MSPDFAIKHERDRDGVRLIFVDTDKARFKQLKWKDLGTFGKRKFENLIVLQRSKERIKVIYE